MSQRLSLIAIALALLAPEFSYCQVSEPQRQEPDSEPASGSNPSSEESPAQGRLSAASFGKQLAKNLAGIFSTSNAAPALIGGGITASSSLLDDELAGYLSENRRLKELGGIGQVVGNGASVGGFSAAMFIWSRQTEDSRFRSMGYSLVQGFILQNGLVAGLKTATQRTRPNGLDGRAFPSGHAASVFVVATVVSHHYPNWTVPAYATAVLVGASRLENNRHWLSDVVAGGTLGYIVGRAVVRNTGLQPRENIHWRPIIPPGGGIGITVSIPVLR